MIAVKIHAGLGNQLFQYAFALALATTHKTKLLVDGNYAAFYPTSSEIPPQSFYLQRFGIFTSPEFDTPLLRWGHKILPNRILKKIYITTQRKKVQQLQLQNIVDDMSHDPKDFYYLSDQVYLDGYFQYPEFFEFLKEDLKKIFIYQKPDLPKKDLLLLQEASAPVILNLRRKDYLHPTNLNNQGICSLDYYRKAITFFKEKFSNPTFFIISDDVDESMQFLQPLPEDLIPLNIDPDKDVLSDFYFMQHCPNVVIANSSYSWWAAYLNTHSDKIIVAPKDWVANIQWSRYNKTIVPAAWTRL